MPHNSCQSSGGDKNWTDFVTAIEEGDESRVRSILLETNKGAPNPFLACKIRKPQETLTPLHLAVKHGRQNIVKLLLENGSDIHAVDHPYNCTALHTAVVQDDCNVEVIQLLLNQRGINVDAVDEYGNTPIKLAAEKGNCEAVRVLIGKEAVVTKADIVDNTALHVAAEKGHYQVLKLLLPKIAKNPGLICQQNKDKNTPLHLAVKKECQTTVAMLLCSGALTSMEVKNKHNETPKQLAAGAKGILELLEDTTCTKAGKLLQELFRPSVRTIGRGGSVEADSPGQSAVVEHISQVTHSGLSQLVGLLPGVIPQVVLSTPGLTIHNEFKTEVRDGAYAAIGPDAQLHVGDSIVTTAVRPQPAAAAVESSYHVNVSGGNVSIGDHSVTNVGTGTPRTPSAAGSSEGPWFSEDPENRTARHPVSQAANTSGGALSYPVLEETSSGSPTENVSKSPGELPHPVPEERSSKSSGEKASVSVTSGESPYPVPERSRAGIPTENASDSGAPGKLPYPVPEESQLQKEEVQGPSQNSVKDIKPLGEAGHEDSTNPAKAATEIKEHSEGAKSRETLEGCSETTTTVSSGSVINKSVERGIVSSRVTEGSESFRVSGNSNCSRDVGKVPAEGKSNDSPSSNSTIQAIGSSGVVGADKVNAVGVSSSKTGRGWGPTLQKNRGERLRRDVPLSRAAPKETKKRLLEIETSTSSTSDPTLSDILGKTPLTDPSSEYFTENRPLTESREFSGGGAKPKSPVVECQSTDDTAKKGGRSGAESGVLLSRIELRGGTGPSLLLTKGSSGDQAPMACSHAGASGDVSENAASTRLNSSSKEASHRKERFLRGDSFPDGDISGEVSPSHLASSNGSMRTAPAASVNSSSTSGDIRREQETVPRGNSNSETQPQGFIDSSITTNDVAAVRIRNANPEDDIEGAKRCDHDCTIM